MMLTTKQPMAQYHMHRLLSIWTSLLGMFLLVACSVGAPLAANLDEPTPGATQGVPPATISPTPTRPNVTAPARQSTAARATATLRQTIPTNAETPISTATRTPLPLANLIRLAWFYKPPVDGNLQKLVDFFDLFILTKKDEPARDALYSLGARRPILQYLLLFEIQDPGSCTQQPFANQVAYARGDLCRLRREHPDWFLLDEHGRPIVDRKTVYMDPGHPGFRAFWLERARQTQEQLGWEGVFIDNIEASLLERRNLARRSQSGMPAAYPDDASYLDAVTGFLEYLRLNYFAPQGRPMWGNITALAEPEAWFRILNYLDGAMIEAFAVDWNDGYRSPEEWEKQLSLAERTQDLGKSVILVAQGQRDDLPRQLFALASYLLVNQGQAYFRYADACCYHQAWIYDNYAIDLGAPLGRRYTVGPFVQRDFENGYVIVDPYLHTARIELKP